MERMQSTHALEMRHVEARVRTAVAKKDESIGALREQLGAALAQLRGTEAVLEAQQADLCD
jgi:hypothetical protein